MDHPQVTEYINNAPENQKEIMGKIRSLIHQSVPGVVEEFKWGRPVFVLKKDFAYLKTNKNYLTLGFMSFQKIKDSEGLLEGTGKDMRHIKLKSLNDIREEVLKEWFKALTE